MKQRLDATFERINVLDADPELRSDFAKYLCILVSGYLENAVVVLVREHARRSGGPSLQRFVESRTKRFTNANAQRIQELLGSFDDGWRAAMEGCLVEERKDAVNSVVALRNAVAHGQSVDLTYQRIAEYYGRVQKVIERIADLCVPTQDS